jgi:hypothetical protein
MRDFWRELVFLTRGGTRDIKRNIKHNRTHYLICICCACIGIIIALSMPCSVDSRNTSFLYRISIDDFNPFTGILCLVSFTFIYSLVIFVAGINLQLFSIVGYGSIFVGSCSIWRATFNAIHNNPLTGILNLILFIIPIFIVNFALFSYILASVYDARSYRARQNRKCTLRCDKHLLLPYCKMHLLRTLIFNLTLWTVLVAIFSTIYA